MLRRLRRIAVYPASLLTGGVATALLMLVISAFSATPSPARADNCEQHRKASVDYLDLALKESHVLTRQAILLQSIASGLIYRNCRDLK